MIATARVTILMTPEEKATLFAQAKRAGFDSVGEYLRRKARLLDELDDRALDEVLVAVRESTANANAALDKALAGMAEYERRWGSEGPANDAGKRKRRTP